MPPNASGSIVHEPYNNKQEDSTDIRRHKWSGKAEYWTEEGNQPWGWWSNCEGWV